MRDIILRHIKKGIVWTLLIVFVIPFFGCSDQCSEEELCDTIICARQDKTDGTEKKNSTKNETKSDNSTCSCYCHSDLISPAHKTQFDVHPKQIQFSCDRYLTVKTTQEPPLRPPII